MAKSRADLERLRDSILALSPADRLRVAVGLLEEGKYDVAEPIIRNVADELAAVRLLGPRA